jgi:nitrite reductase (NADH) large subunit
VAPLYEQGNILAKKLAGVETGEGYQGSVVSTKLKVSGVNVFSAGDFDEKPGRKAVRVQDDFSRVYKKVVIQAGKVIGAVLFGDTSDGSRLFSMIRSEEDVNGREREILLGSGGAAKTGVDFVAAMPDDEIVCGCNGVSKGAIVQAINEKGCTSVNEIKACTKASGSCGGCKPLVADLLTYTLGEDGVKTVKEGICGCTTHSRDEVVAAIQEMRLTTSKEVIHVLEWSNPEGCSKCRPALNYYLGMVWPVEHEEERESRFVNERNHANIQHDGTYSVVPRIYGGVTTPKDLMKIAEVAEKYNVPMVKFTGGQRIDLLGIKKEDLTSIWADLDMPSGYAYGKALRTVKTCVGNTFCRFGTQDAIQMGIDLEKKFERLNTPAKIKMAVSGCPRNCAESIIKDFGVVAIDGGWELYVGGNGGVRVRAAELLVKVKTNEEVLEWSGAFLQYYRENGRFNERTSEWIEREGVQSVRDALESKEVRLALVGRIEKTLSLAVDPWKEIIKQEKLSQIFQPLKACESIPVES